MQRPRLLAYIFGIGSWIMAILAYLEHFYMAGFPDGALTDLQRGQQKLFSAFILLSILLGAFFFLIARRASLQKYIGTAMFAYIMMLVMTFGVNSMLPSFLLGGGGG